MKIKVSYEKKLLGTAGTLSKNIISNEEIEFLYTLIISLN